MIVPLSTQIMVNSHYGKRLKLFQFYLIIISAIFIEYHECRRDYTNCCEILKIISSSFLAKFHPEHLGSYKLMKNSKNVYISLTEPNSYIYLLSLGKGNWEVLNIDIAILNFVEKANSANTKVAESQDRWIPNILHNYSQRSLSAKISHIHTV